MICALPFYNETYKINKSYEEILGTLKGMVDEEIPLYSRMYSRLYTESQPFCGEFYGNAFKISRLISYGNPLLPIIIGRIEKGSDYNCIVFRVRLSVFSQITLLIYLLFTILACILSHTLIPSEFFAFLYIMVMLPFNYLLNKDMKIIHKRL